MNNYVKRLLELKSYKFERDKFIERLINKIDLFERRTIERMRADGKLLFLSELIPYFKGTKIFTFANGGSVANLSNVSRLRDFNLMAVHNGPFYMYQMYGFVPNIWYLHFGPSARVVMEDEKQNPLDFSDTFILVPANDSKSTVYFSSPIIKKFRERHPEATYVLYREIRSTEMVKSVPKTYLIEGIEPLRMFGSGSLHSAFLPISGFLGVSTLYFSGEDHLPTGHFYDRSRLYQSMDGRLLEFPDKERVLTIDAEVQSICAKRNIKVYRLEEKETIFKTYPFLEFDKSLDEASPKIIPELVRDRQNATLS
jgi:hypothetical protein